MIKAAKSLTAISISILILSACGGGGSSAPAVVVTPPPAGGGGSTGGATGSVVLSDILYGKTNRNRLDIYQPSGTCSTNRQTIFYVHGGGFVGGDKTGSQAPELAKAANERGANFVSINYRLLGNNPVLSPEFQAIYDDLATQISVPDPLLANAVIAAVEDAVDALVFLETNSDQYCLDMSRLAYWGSSAGAYTVLQVGYGLNQYNIARPDPDVVIDYWGALPRITDLEFREAPFLILHGTADGTVDYQSAVVLAEQGDAVDVPYSFYSVQGGGHAYGSIDIYNTQINGKSILDTTLDFVDAHIVGGTPTYETVTITP